jgi:predicted CXXCH cytochrome family protein
MKEAVSVVVLAALCGAAGCDRTSAPPPTENVEPRATFVGDAACVACHTQEAEAWNGSQHQRAMQAAGPDTVRGDFSGATFSAGGVTSTFTRRGDDFVVTTQGSDGERDDYRVAFTFGAEPLQQYLLEMPDRRLQAFDVAWDTRPAPQGGQRWFHLQPGERIPPGDPLHWTGVLLNWNASCAECHSTNVEKNYDPRQDSYATTFSSIAVGCEACHGPGSRHATAPRRIPLGLAPVQRTWDFTEGGAIAHRVPATHSNAEIEACAGCHSRRSQLTDDFEPGDAFLDGFRPAFLTAPLYYADGQIRDEVYVYGSFLQSKMYAAGVTCTDCHDPHSARLRAGGNAVCTRCHRPAAFDTPQHHRHEAGTPGAECVSCHMPAKTYMVIDPRRDHSFRVPRPDLSVAIGTPNACNDCHEEPAAWAAAKVADWFPEGRNGGFHYAEALHAGREWAADRNRLLRRVIADTETPAIVRGTALELLAEQIDDASLDSVRAALEDGEPLVRLAALDALAAMPTDLRAELGQRFLTDPLRALRLAAAQALLPARASLSVRRQADLDAAVGELRASQRFNMDRPEGLLSRASVELARGRTETAEQALRLAIQRQPAYVAGYVNLADLYRVLGREAEAQQTLEDGLGTAPDSAALHYALGLTLVRRERPQETLAQLRRASELEPGDPLYAYGYAVALNSFASPAQALDVLTRAHERFPGYRPILVALATMQRDAGHAEEALRYARLLLELSPADATARALIAELERSGP